MMHPKMSRFLIGLFLAALSIVGFASTFIVGSALTRSCAVSPEVLAFLRFVIAGAAMAVPAAWRPPARAQFARLTREDWLTLLWLGPIGTTVMAWCVFQGCARVSAANASMADALTPIMIFLVAVCKTRRARASELFSLVCGLVGALLVIQIVTVRGLALEAYSLGDVYVLLAAATWGVYTVYGREPIARLGSSLFTLLTMLIGAAALGIFLPFLDLAWPTTGTAWLLVATLGLVSTLLPFWTWNAAQKYLPMSVLGVSAYFTPVVAVALAVLFLGESATPLQWLGTAFIVLSGVLESRAGRGRSAGPNRRARLFGIIHVQKS